MNRVADMHWHCSLFSGTPVLLLLIIGCGDSASPSRQRESPVAAKAIGTRSSSPATDDTAIRAWLVQRGAQIVDGPDGRVIGVGLVLQATLTEDDFEHLARLPQLRSINFYRSGLTDADLKRLPRWRDLEWLTLTGTRVTDTGLSFVRELPSLRRLELDSTSVGDAGLAHLATLPRLEFLNLNRTGITDAGLEQLVPLTSLRALHLQNTNIGDAGLVHVAQFTGLLGLGFQETQVTDAGLESLRELGYASDRRRNGSRRQARPA